jgi:ATP-dependent 26S proteasome regulatory subunit
MSGEREREREKERERERERERSAGSTQSTVDSIRESSHLQHAVRVVGHETDSLKVAPLAVASVARGAHEKSGTVESQQSRPNDLLRG